MLREEVELVRQIVKEEIAAALATIKPTAKVVVGVETPKPVEVDTKAKTEALKQGK
jgi:hypothetical protein